MVNGSDSDAHTTTSHPEQGPARARRDDEHLLAVDAGTGTIRAVLFDVTGRQVAEGRREWSHSMDPAVPGSQVFDATGNWALVAQCVRDAVGAIADPASIRAVSCCSMGGGLLLYDGAGMERWACANGDARAGREAEELLESGEAERLYRLGGGWLSLGAPPRLRWVRRHKPEVFRSVRHLTMVGDWIGYRLSGEFATDPSLGSTSGMFDLPSRTWSDVALDACELSPTVVPAVADAGTPVGSVTESAAAATGLRAGTPVVAGGADTALALIGTGQSRPRTLSVTGGSFWKQSVAVSDALIDPGGRLRTTCHALPSRWLVEGIAFYAGLALRWLRDRHAGGDELAGVANPYQRLEELGALVPPGAHGVRATTSPSDAWSWNPPPATFLDPRQECTTAPGVGTRAIEEAAAFTSRAYVQAIEDLVDLRFSRATFTGGASRGTLWPRILADVLGVEVHIAPVGESAARGAALLAGVGAGAYGSLADAPPPPSEDERVVVADPVAHRVYDALYARWMAGQRGTRKLRGGP